LKPIAFVLLAEADNNPLCAQLLITSMSILHWVRCFFVVVYI